MITLSIIAYIIISLGAAWHLHGNPEYTYTLRQVNPCYLNSKKALQHGFLFIPKWLLICGSLALLMYGICWAVFGSIGWIFTNMP